MNNGVTPLFNASHNGHLPFVEQLLQENVDPNAPMNDGATPLFVASHNGHLPVVERLLQQKVDPNTLNDNGTTPPMAAIVLKTILMLYSYSSTIMLIQH